MGMNTVAGPPTASDRSAGDPSTTRHDRPLTMVALVGANLWAKKARSAGIAFAVALAVMTVVTLTVVSSGLETAASAVLTVGKADFTVAQNGVSDLLYSNIDTGQLARIAATPGVKSSSASSWRRSGSTPTTPSSSRSASSPAISPPSASPSWRVPPTGPRRATRSCSAGGRHRTWGSTWATRSTPTGPPTGWSGSTPRDLLRRLGGHVPAPRTPGLQPGPGDRLPGLREDRPRAVVGRGAGQADQGPAGADDDLHAWPRPVGPTATSSSSRPR